MSQGLFVRTRYAGILWAILAVLAIVGLYEASVYNFLLFHILAELFVVVVAANVFVLAWNTRRFLDNNYLQVIGIAFLFIAVLHLVHALAYKGMGIFADGGSDIATQLWLSARYMAALSFLIAPLFLGRRIRSDRLIGFSAILYLALTVLLLHSIFNWSLFPAAYDDQTGRLTPFKIFSEYIICLLFLLSILLVYSRRRFFSQNVLWLIIAATAAGIPGELMFTRYAGVYGWQNLLGHYLTILSFALIYKALVETGLRRPYELIWRDLKKNEEALRESQQRFDSFMQRVPGSAYMKDAEGRFLFVNDRFCQLVGREREELIGQSGRDLWPQSLAEEIPRDDHRALLENRFLQKTYNYPDGNVLKTFLTYRFPIDPESPRIIMGSIWVDITEQKQIEDILRRKENQLSTVLSSLPVGVWVTDADGRIIISNPAAQTIWGGTRYAGIDQFGDFRGWWVDSGKPLEKEDWTLNRALRSGQPCLNDLIEIECFDSTHKFVMKSAIPIQHPDEQGQQVLGVLVLTEDITDRVRAEQAVKESELRERARAAELQAVMDAVPVPVLIATDPQCRFITGSRSLYELLDLPPGSNASLAAPDHDTPRHFKVYRDGRELPPEEMPIRKVIREGSAIEDMELELVFDDGRTHYLFGSASPLKNSQGQVTGAVAGFVDVTERKQAQEEIRKASERATQVLESVTDGFLSLDPDWNFVYVNRSAARMLGMDREAMLGRNMWELFPEAVHTRFHEEYHRAVREQIRIEFEAHYPPDDAWFECHVYPRDDGLSVYFSDKTASHQAEEAVRLSEERMRVAIKNSPITVFSQDADLRYNWIYNPSELFSPEVVIGKTDHELFKPEQAEWLNRLKRRVMETGEINRREMALTYQEKDHFYDLTLEPLYNHQGQVMGIIGAAINITGHKRTEEMLRRITSDLARSNQDLEQFAYVASHDLQEPLRMVTGYLQLIQRRYQGKLDQDADEFIKFAVDGANHMQTLINDLLAYSRVGTRRKKFSPTDCEKVLQRVLDNLELAIEESGAEITHDPLPTFQADTSQIARLLQNLIGNAIKFRSERPLKIHIGAQEKPDHWHFFVTDNGIGIEEQYNQRIFMVFQRLHSREHYKGTGIGLAICKKIVDRHGGSIGLESTPGQGTTFWFTIRK